MENGLLLILLFFMIVGSLIAVETRSLLSAIISIGAIGFLLSIAFLLLGAPDIAITQVVVEILCLIILIRATINRDLTTISGDREFFSTVITVTMVIIITVISVHIFSEADKTVDALRRYSSIPLGGRSNLRFQMCPQIRIVFTRLMRIYWRVELHDSFS